MARLLACLAVREKGLVETHDRRTKGIHVAARELQYAGELPCFRRCHVQTVGQLIDGVSRLHGSVYDARQPESSGGGSRHALKLADQIARFLRYTCQGGSGRFHWLRAERRLHGTLRFVQFLFQFGRIRANLDFQLADVCHHSTASSSSNSFRRCSSSSLRRCACRRASFSRSSG